MRTAKKSLAITAFLVLAGTSLATAGPAAAAEPAASRPASISSGATTGSGPSKVDVTYYFHTVWSTSGDCANRGRRGISNGEWIDWICVKDGLHSSIYKWSLYVR
ncbi:hypothetical protein AB0P21_14400 [Kribbella sp. NPDC056861]|uniref:hypothetical protein n=1 Tax=Kribbella sp. NPDC056861 TaxID=3154857 RepID=UPI0034288183